MKHRIQLIILYCISINFLFACNHSTTQPHTPGLKNAMNGKFYIGTALNTSQIKELDKQSVELIQTHFNSIVAENCMKAEVIHSRENQYNFTLADQFVEFGQKNNMKIIGHTLIWHSQLPAWFCTDEKGENVSPEVLKQRMKEHIHTIVGRYKGIIQGWDVVNEALMDDGSYRESKFYEILGEDYIPLAFQYAHEADPNAELYYNDFSMANPARREGAIRIIKLLKQNGCRIDAIGMQAHLGMNYPSVNAFEESILAYAAENVKVMITELDLTLLPSPNSNGGANIEDNYEYEKQMNPYAESLPDEVSKKWNNQMMEFFQLFLKHHEVIDRVTLWGVTDNDSWRNDWPIKGRTDYALLFDRDYQPKPVITELLQNSLYE